MREVVIATHGQFLQSLFRYGEFPALWLSVTRDRTILTSITPESHQEYFPNAVMRSFVFEGDEIEGPIPTGTLASRREELKM